MKKPINYLMILFCIGILIACTKDFIQKDIKNDLVNIVAPTDGLNTPSNAVTFWWDELEGAEKYNLQIVKPDFNSVIQLMVDTTITVNKFYYTLNPGTYQWRIKAINGGGSTAYVTRTLTIDTTSNLNFLSVTLSAPANNSVIASSNITFSWSPLPTASYYQLSVAYSSTGTYTTVSNITTTNYTYTFSIPSGTEEKFKWNVKAFNSFSQTINDVTRTFKIDHKSPGIPTLNYPLHLTTVRDSSSFRWTYNNGTDIKFDSIYIGTYPDSTFTNPIKLLVSRVANATGSYSINPTLSSPTNTLTASSYYWWKVKSIDSVGNVSSPSGVYKFKLMN